MAKPAHSARKTRRKPAGDSAATLLEAVRKVVREWLAELAKPKRKATGKDAHGLLYDVSEAAWPKHK